MENYSRVGFRTHFVSMDSEEVWWNFAKIMDCRLEPCVGLPGLRGGETRKRYGGETPVTAGSTQQKLIRTRSCSYER